MTARRFFPNFINLDATFNRHELWRADDPKRYLYETATMGCRTRVLKTVSGRRPLSDGEIFLFATINIVRLAIECMEIADEEERIACFFAKLDHMLDITARQLHERMEFQKIGICQTVPVADVISLAG